jgi:hypothetical protein
MPIKKFRFVFWLFKDLTSLVKQTIRRLKRFEYDYRSLNCKKTFVKLFEFDLYFIEINNKNIVKTIELLLRTEAQCNFHSANIYSTSLRPKSKLRIRVILHF